MESTRPRPLASVVVPAYNCENTIAQNLKALASQTIAEPFEIIVVDDGSTDQTSDIIKEFEGVMCLHQNNSGPAAARNHGARYATGHYIVFTDSDCVPHQDWIQKLTAGFKHSEIGAVCGSYGITNPESRLARCIHMEILYRHHKLMPDFPKAFGSYNVAIKDEVFRQTGGFDESYRQASGEDNDLSYKILQAGYKIYFERKALVNHTHTVRLTKYLKEQYRHGFWRMKMYADHPGKITGDDYTFWKDILEVPLVGFQLFVFLGFCCLGFTGLHLVFFTTLFFLLELVFSYLMTGNFKDGLYYAWAMWLRAFARTAGFLTGMGYCSIKRLGFSN